MIRLTLRQFRLQAAVAAIGLAAVAILLVVTGRELYHLYNTTVANCAAQSNCTTVRDVFRHNDVVLQQLLGPFLMIIPALVGIFWGAPLVARELETGTYRLAWTQGVTRLRWLLIKLGVFGIASMIVVGLISLMVTWWFRPFDRIDLNRFAPGVFDARGVVVIGYAAFAFALGVTAGVILRRALPAMAVTLVAFLTTRLAFIFWIRPHLLTPAHVNVPVTTSGDLGFTLTPNGVTFVADKPTMPNAWTISSQIVDQSGHPASNSALHQFLQTACPAIAQGPAGASAGHAPANPADFDKCVAQVGRYYHLLVTYQPASRYWTFQWYEMAIFVGLAVALSAFSLWWVRYRLA